MERIKKGDRVRVISGSYQGKTLGMLGTVDSYDERYNRYAVRIDNLENTRSARGVFYYAKSHIKKLEEAYIMEGNYAIATVKFLEGNNTDKTYRYALYDVNKIVVGDICVGKTAHHGFGLVRIIDIGPKTSEEITREIVCKADFTDYGIRCQMRERRKELMAQMRQRAEKLQEITLFQTLAQADGEMAELIKEFNHLNGGNA